MSTLPQIEANRRNARKSTGPTSVTGKATSSMNALKTGIHAESLVLPSEDVDELEQLTADFYQHHQPATPDARCFVDELIYCEWMLRRLRLAESQAWQYHSDDPYRDPQKYPLGQSATCHSTTFAKLQYRIDATRRARLRALQALKEIKAEAGAASPPLVQPVDLPTPLPQIGFVPATSLQATPQPLPTPPNSAPDAPEDAGNAGVPRPDAPKSKDDEPPTDLV